MKVVDRPMIAYCSTCAYTLDWWLWAVDGLLLERLFPVAGVELLAAIILRDDTMLASARAPPAEGGLAIEITQSEQSEQQVRLHTKL